MEGAKAQISPKALIIDSDIYSDCDDVGALAVANVLHNFGLADIRGVMVNTHSKYGCLAVNAINNYYGNGHVPVAAVRPFNDDTFQDTRNFILGEYASKVAHNFPRTLKNAEDALDPVTSYRTILSKADDKSITIISIGFLVNLAGLLQSPGDQISPLSGQELISRKVEEFVVMGGRYPSGKSWNFSGQGPKMAAFVINEWPRICPVVFAGTQPGADIVSGKHLSNAPFDSPIRAAYEWYSSRNSTARKSWDPVTMLYAILGRQECPLLGVGALFDYEYTHGYNKVEDDGSNHWVPDKSATHQRVIKLKDGVQCESLSWLLEKIYTTDPIQRRLI